MTTATQILQENISRFYSNPSASMTTTLNVLEMALGDIDIVDPTNPFVALLECACTGISAHILKSESLIRQAYPKLAVTREELYHHIADKQYVGIFALPAKASIIMMLPLSDIIKNAIYLNNSINGTLVIPANTKITVLGDITLELGYPIVINVLPNNIITVRYDNSVDNPLLPINTNTIESRNINYSGAEYLQLTIPCVQTNTTSTVFAINNLSSFTQSIPFSDNYVHLRAYISVNGADWVEIKTTHSPKVYDIKDPTVKLMLNDNYVQVTLPDIYQSLAISGNSLRVDVITTKGNITNDFKQIETGSWGYTFLDYNTINVNPATAPLEKFNDIIIYSLDSLWGGQLALTFDELRKVVIYNNNGVSVPIRPSDIEMHLRRRGYTARKIIGTVTNRVYTGAKRLPTLTIDNVELVPLCTNQSVNFKASDLVASSFKTHDTNRVTIIPTTLYKVENDNVVVVSDSELYRINNLSKVQLCDELNNNTYLYSQFYYILDYTETVLRSRVYNLFAPSILARTLEGINERNDYGVVTTGISIVNDGNKYIVRVFTTIPLGLTNLFAQLRCIDSTNNTYGFKNSYKDISGNAAIFTFELNTDFDISANGILFLKMISSSGTEVDVGVQLNTLFDLYYFSEGDNTGLETTFDNEYTGYAFNGTISVVHETVTLKFGTDLTLLYCPAKEILPTPKYMTYDADVPLLYTEKLFVSGPYGRDYEIVDGRVVWTTQPYEIGDPVLDDNGDPILLHSAGDIILDISGKAVPLDNNSTVSVKQCGLTLLDAKFKYSTLPTIKDFTDKIPNTIEGYIQKEITPLSETLNELTHLYFMPSGDVKNILVDLGDGSLEYVSPLVNINVTLLVTKNINDDENIKDIIRQAARNIIYNMLSGKFLSTSLLTSSLIEIDKIGITSCIVHTFLPNDLHHLTIMDDGVNMSPETEVFVTEDKMVSIRDKIKIVFKGPSK